MPITLLPALLIYILVVGYTPGPANIYSLSCALKYGRKASLLMWRGLLCGFLIAVTTVAVLTHCFGTVIGNYVNNLKYLGAAYIFWLAFNIFRRRGNLTTTVNNCSFLSGMLVQLTNAKMILFDLTVFSMFVLPYSNRLADLLTVSLILTLAGPGGNLVWLLAGSYLGRFFTNYGRQVDVVMSICLAACALYIVLG